jgi:ATP-dependent helicase/nuclease subunit B
LAVALNLFAIAPGAPFLDTLAAGWLREHGADPLSVANGMILTPTRRAARSLAEAFLRVSAGRGLLLPRIVALGALDEAPLALAGALDLPPAVEPARRLAILSRLILRMNGAGGAPRTADRAWLLAAELAKLMDEADRAEIDLAARLPDAADARFAAHWAKTLEFLRIVTHAWPAWLEENGVMNPAARQVALLKAQSEAWRERAPEFPVVIAGTTAGIPAVARLARVVARLPLGAVVLPVLDREMSDEAWRAMADSHPQSGLATLLAGLDAAREDIRDWGGASGSFARDPAPHDTNPDIPARFALLSRALLPAETLGAWTDPFVPDLNGLARLRPRDSQEEAEAIAMILRGTLETPARTAALVTPDRELAGRVAAALLRHGVIADDSAGEKLSETPPAVLLRLLARAVAEDLAPVPLLALLKHPLAAAGLPPAICRQHARDLEIDALRGPRPNGLAGLRRAAETAKPNGPRHKDFLDRVVACLAPALRVEASVAIAPVQWLAALIAAAENLAATDDATGPDRIWADEEGEALATALVDALDAMPHLPDQSGTVIPGLLDAILAGQMTRGRRALRGRGGTEHPRVFIWGPLEARLQSVDVAVLGGLVESVWPPAPEPGPWLSRPMRLAVGLPSPEVEVGLAAHDFAAAAVSAPEVVLSCPERRDGAPAVPARWLTRLDAFLASHHQKLPEHPAVHWARVMDHPPDGPRPVAPPRPCPPVHVRPMGLSVTEIETWLRDPYAIYARRILGLRRLADLDEETDAADYGMLVHNGLRIFLDENGIALPANAEQRMRDAMRRALAEAFVRPALFAWWEPRLERIADWVVKTERERRALTRLADVKPEAEGKLELRRPGRLFTLRGRADRIERREDGTIAILDYKTGQPPSHADVNLGLAPQLPLEAAMVAAGGFGEALRGEAAELTYWHLAGGFQPGEAVHLFKQGPDALRDGVAAALRGLQTLIDRYDEPDRCYLAHPYPAWKPRFSDYEQLARVAEWSLAGDEDDA